LKVFYLAIGAAGESRVQDLSCASALKSAVIALRVLKDNAKNLYGAKYGLLRHMGGQTDPGAAASSSSQANIKLRSSIIKR